MQEQKRKNFKDTYSECCSDKVALFKQSKSKQSRNPTEVPKQFKSQKSN